MGYLRNVKISRTFFMTLSPFISGLLVIPVASVFPPGMTEKKKKKNPNSFLKQHYVLTLLFLHAFMQVLVIIIPT